MGDLNVKIDDVQFSDQDKDQQNFKALLIAGDLVDVHRYFNVGVNELSEGGWTYQNNTLPPSLTVSNPKHRLDYALISLTLASDILKFEVNYQTKVSDHKPVELTLRLNSNNENLLHNLSLTREKDVQEAEVKKANVGIEEEEEEKKKEEKDKCKITPSPNQLMELQTTARNEHRSNPQRGRINPRRTQLYDHCKSEKENLHYQKQ
jgi:hypothetical protein